jgi:hypothetical protein
VTLVPESGYTFNGYPRTADTAAALATLFSTADYPASIATNSFNNGSSDNLVFTVSYPIDRIEIAASDLAGAAIGDLSAADAAKIKDGEPVAALSSLAWGSIIAASNVAGGTVAFDSTQSTIAGPTDLATTDKVYLVITLKSDVGYIFDDTLAITDFSGYVTATTNLKTCGTGSIKDVTADDDTLTIEIEITI